VVLVEDEVIFPNFLFGGVGTGCCCELTAGSIFSDLAGVAVEDGTDLDFSPLSIGFLGIGVVGKLGLRRGVGMGGLTTGAF
jgi:hypothetical protein